MMALNENRSETDGTNGMEKSTAEEERPKMEEELEEERGKEQLKKLEEGQEDDGKRQAQEQREKRQGFGQTLAQRLRIGSASATVGRQYSRSRYSEVYRRLFHSQIWMFGIRFRFIFFFPKIEIPNTFFESKNFRCLFNKS